MSKTIKKFCEVYGMSEEEAEEAVKRVMKDFVKAHPSLATSKCDTCIHYDSGLDGCYWQFDDCDIHYMAIPNETEKQNI